MKKELTAAALLGVIVSIVPSAAYTAPVAAPGISATDSSSLVTQVKKKIPRAGTKTQQMQDCW